MKAFEAWADKEDEDPRSYGSEEWVREQGWRAALGWFYGELGFSEEHEELKDLIDKETKE